MQQIDLGTAASASNDGVSVKTDGTVAVVTLNRPAKLNAADGRAIAALSGADAAVDADDVRAVVVTGAGRAFCSRVLGVASRCLPAAKVLPATLDLALEVGTEVSPDVHH